MSVNSVRAFCKPLLFISLGHVVKALLALLMGIQGARARLDSFCVCVSPRSAIYFS
jgi:hypothetical protein